MFEKFFNNLLMEKECLICKKNIFFEAKEEFICNSCKSILTTKQYDQICPVCAHPLVYNSCPSCSKLKFVYYDSYNFIQYYNDFTKSIIYQLKLFEDFSHYWLIFDLLKKNFSAKENCFITVVPDNFFTRSKKGRCSLYYLLKLFKKNGYNVLKDVYRRRFFFKKQKTKTVESRLNDVSKIFYLPEKNINRYSGRLFLIDDVYTTGATVNYSAYLLKKAGFKEVHVITFFRAVMQWLFFNVIK